MMRSTVRIALAAVYLFFAHTEARMEASSESFWLLQKKGANLFNRQIQHKDIAAAKAYGIEFLRIACDKCASHQRDFLIGDASGYTQLVPEDLQVLFSILDSCAQLGMPVVLTMLSLPGSRWKQLNDGEDDLRLWLDEEFCEQAAQFWRDLATAVGHHPAIVAYDLLNEPHPEKIGHDLAGMDIQRQLYTLYARLIAAVRSVDATTPIIVESSSYADAASCDELMTYDDDHILYSFHCYEPYAYTNRRMNRGRWRYPGMVEDVVWNKDRLRAYLQPVAAFQQMHNIPSHRILVGEFGGHRLSPGLPQYFQDLIDLFNEYGWHHAFYAFREDTWDGMDYELGDQTVPWDYGERDEQDRVAVVRDPASAQFKVLLQNLGA